MNIPNMSGTYLHMLLLEYSSFPGTLSNMHKVSEMALCAHVPRGKTGEDINCPGKLYYRHIVSTEIKQVQTLNSGVFIHMITGAGDYYQHNASSSFCNRHYKHQAIDFVQSTNTKLIVITLVIFFVEGTPS